jgi:hypothetical protein
MIRSVPGWLLLAWKPTPLTNAQRSCGLLGVYSISINWDMDTFALSKASAILSRMGVYQDHDDRLECRVRQGLGDRDCSAALRLSVP